MEAVARDISNQFLTKIDVLDTKPRLVVERDGRIVWKSENATELLREPIPIQIADGFLIADGPAKSFLQEFLLKADAGSATALLRGQSRRHWAMLTGWTLDGRSDHVGLIASLSVPHRGVVESGLAHALKLTSTEARVLDSFARMNRPSEIAEQMRVSLSTVRSHLKQIHCKAGVDSAVQLSQLVRSYCAC